MGADDKIVGITIKNQGGQTVLSSYGSSGLFNQILPLTSESYGGIEGFYLVGNIELDFDGIGTAEAIVKIAYDQGEICDD